MIKAPVVDVEGLADAGCPGALETSGNRMVKRHKAAGQDHTASRAQAEHMANTSAWE
jgi:hypothetical protein